MSAATIRRLNRGEVFGDDDLHRHAAGFTLRCLKPTVPERELERHSHDDAHFVLLLSGRYLTSARGGSPACGAGTLIYNPPGTTHRDRFHDLDGRFFVLSLPEGLTTEDGWSGSAGGARQLDTQARRYAFALARECGRWDADSPSLVEALALELFDAANPRRSELRHAAPGWLDIAREMLEDSAAVPDIAAIAAVCDVHPVHLARVFRAWIGCTPTEHARRARLRRAAAMLRDGPKTLAAIASDCGFADQSHFSRLFLRAFGITPLAYRLAH